MADLCLTACLNRGDAYRVRGDYDRAAADYAAALDLDPGCVAAWVNRGVIRRTTGQTAGARRGLR